MLYDHAEGCSLQTFLSTNVVLLAIRLHLADVLMWIGYAD